MGGLVDKEDTEKSKNVRVLKDDYDLDRQGIEKVVQVGEKHSEKKKHN